MGGLKIDESAIGKNGKESLSLLAEQSVMMIDYSIHNELTLDSTKDPQAHEEN